MLWVNPENADTIVVIQRRLSFTQTKYLLILHFLALVIFFISAPANLQYDSLRQEIIMSIKQYGKTETKNIIKNTYAAFLRYEILKALKPINVDE